MTTTIGKVLAVVTAVGSLVFFGFVTVGVFGGTNWQHIASEIEADDEMPYSFAHSEGESPQWTATKNVGEGSIPPNKALDPVVVAVMEDVNRSEQAELNELTPEISQLDEQIAAADAAIKVDDAAIEAKANELLDDLKQLRDQVQAATEQAQLQGEEVQKVKDRIEARREDVFRLSAQLEEIRGDRFRIQQIQQQLTDLIQQLDGSIERAQRRRDQLDNYKPAIQPSSPN